MLTTKAPPTKDQLALTYTDKDIKRVMEDGPSEVRRILFFIHEEKSNSCTFKELKDLLASHSVNDKGFSELLEYLTKEKLLHMHLSDRGTMLTMTENAKAVLSRIDHGRVIR